MSAHGYMVSFEVIKLSKLDCSDGCILNILKTMKLYTSCGLKSV